MATVIYMLGLGDEYEWNTFRQHYNNPDNAKVLSMFNNIVVSSPNIDDKVIDELKSVNSNVLPIKIKGGRHIGFNRYNTIDELSKLDPTIYSDICMMMDFDDDYLVPENWEALLKMVEQTKYQDGIPCIIDLNYVSDRFMDSNSKSMDVLKAAKVRLLPLDPASQDSYDPIEGYHLVNTTARVSGVTKFVHLPALDHSLWLLTPKYEDSYIYASALANGVCRLAVAPVASIRYNRAASTVLVNQADPMLHEVLDKLSVLEDDAVVSEVPIQMISKQILNWISDK